MPKVSTWTALLKCRDTSVRLHIYEEQLNERKPVFCDSCRIIGELCHHAQPLYDGLLGI